MRHETRDARRALAALLTSSLILLHSPATAGAAGVAPFADGERVTFLGDSITHGGMYHVDLQLYWDLRHPGSGTRLMNCGISGESSSGGLKRWPWDAAPQKADRTFVMFGMNDVGRGLYAKTNPDAGALTGRTQRLGWYVGNMTKIVDKTREAGQRTVLVTPTPFDEYGADYDCASAPGCNEQGLAACAAAVRRLATEKKTELLDLHRPLTEFLRREEKLRFNAGGDRVHPIGAGHLVILAEILKAMGEPSDFGGADVDAGGKSTVAFRYAPKTLPLPVTENYRAADRAYPLTDTINREILTVRNLPTGRYTLTADGDFLGTFTDLDFLVGVNLALLPTPGAKRALEAAKAAFALKEAQEKRRGIVFIETTAENFGAKRESFDDVCAKLGDLVARLQREKRPWAPYYEKQLASYKANKPREAEFAAEEERARAQLAAIGREPAAYELKLAPFAPMPVLGYQLDVSRDKVPTMETLYRIVDILAGLGYNQFQLYTEHTFAYSKHRTVWEEASPMTPEEIRALDAYCAGKGIELVPNQNSFGHLEHWLKHPEYNDLAEAPQGGSSYKPWKNYILPKPTSLNPTDPRSIAFVGGLYDELFPCFRSTFVNVGGDETIELLDDGNPSVGRSAAEIAKKGAHRVYLDFICKLHRECARRGHTMMFWGDIVLQHPELLPDLPKDVVCLNWGYEAAHPFETQTAALEKSGRAFIVCPGTSAWGSLFGRVSNMLANIDNAMTAAAKHGAKGALLADWGDGGHPNPWIVSLPAIVYLSHAAKGVRLTRDQLAAALDKVLGCKGGAALLAYGDVYLKAKGRRGNSTELYYLLREGRNYERAGGVTDETLAAALQAAREAKACADLTGAPQWVADDFAMLDLLSRAVAERIKDPKKRNFRAMFEPEYRRLWRGQYRVGGLQDSLFQLFGVQ